MFDKVKKFVKDYPQLTYVSIGLVSGIILVKVFHDCPVVPDTTDAIKNWVNMMDKSGFRVFCYDETAAKEYFMSLDPSGVNWEHYFPASA